MRRAAILLGLLLAGPAGSQESAPVDFDRDVRPILAASCLKCHGSQGRPKGQLRLDLRSAAMRGGVSGRAIVPGKSAESLLYRRLVDPDEDARMPQKAPRLGDRAIALLRRWIDEGARWTPGSSEEDAGAFWSLRPLAAPAVPAVRSPWIRTPIDAFVLSRLEGRGWAPSPEADRRTLLRRLSYDLTGLPPTPQEVEAFLADGAPDAYEKRVDALLGSPRYGERWARHWLDAVHYADTHGHDQDRPRPNAWPYRDYLIASLNGDKPYARFVQEQLAGDVLYPDDPQGIVATGFIAAGPWDESSQMHIMADTLDKKIAQNLDRDDMLTATLSTFMSVTVQCARCHNHKFDPILQTEYYSLQSCFAGVDRANRPYDLDPELNRRRQALLRTKTDLAVRRKGIAEALEAPAMEEEVRAWERHRTDGPGVWTILHPEAAVSKEGSILVPQSDGSVLSQGPRPATDTYTIRARSPLSKITAVRLETLTIEDHPYRGPGRQDNGNFHLSEFRVRIVRPDGQERTLALVNPTADFNQAGWTIEHAVDGKPETAWGIYPEVGKTHAAIFELKEPLAIGEGDRLSFELAQLHGRFHLIARPRLAVTAAPCPLRFEALPAELARIAGLDSARRTRAEETELAAWVFGRRIDRELAALPEPRWVYAAANDFVPIAKFSPARAPRPIFVLRRGDITQPEAPARPGGLSCIPGLPSEFELADPGDEGARRAALARWIVDRRNVLTWRSIVNRVWHHHFGRGIADSPNDLGRMGSPPSHPELLDWLAVWFRDGGGSLKRLHRLIVTSSVYRQSSMDRPECSRVDASNVWLWRMNRSRLDAEEVRDSMLALSGRLDPTMGGPSVKQFNYDDPNPGVTPKVDYMKFDVERPEASRRSIYRWIFRTLPDPFMETLDCPDASQLTGARNVSVTPLQALAVMNDRFVVRQSEHLAARAGCLEEAFGLIFQRAPRAEERRRLAAYAATFGLANTCRVLLNTNEFMFLD